jgi:hypothetical protein
MQPSEIIYERGSISPMRHLIVAVIRIQPESTGRGDTPSPQVGRAFTEVTAYALGLLGQ